MNSSVISVIKLGEYTYEVNLRNDGVRTKRFRTAFSFEDVRILEAEFAIGWKPDRLRLHKIADKLKYKPQTIRIWFQNRRMKYKNDQKKKEQCLQSSKSSCSSSTNHQSLQGSNIVASITNSKENVATQCELTNDNLATLLRRKQTLIPRKIF